jgi:hypothetical protein
VSRTVACKDSQPVHRLLTRRLDDESDSAHLGQLTQLKRGSLTRLASSHSGAVSDLPLVILAGLATLAYGGLGAGDSSGALRRVHETAGPKSGEFRGPTIVLQSDPSAEIHAWARREGRTIYRSGAAQHVLPNTAPVSTHGRRGS